MCKQMWMHEDYVHVRYWANATCAWQEVIRFIRANKPNYSGKTLVSIYIVGESLVSVIFIYFAKSPK